MPTFVHIGDGSKTVFRVTSSANAKTVRVNGVAFTPFATAAASVTFAAAPAVGAIIEVFYAPLNGVDTTQPAVGGSPSLPLAIETLFKPAITPVIRYWCAGSDSLAFTPDPLAKTIDVYPDNVKTSY